MKAFWKKWILYCGIGEMLGVTLAAAVAYFTLVGLKGPPSWGTQLSVLGLMALAGLLEGSFLGFFQWKVLSEKIPALSRSGWIGLTAILTIFGWVFLALGFLLFYPEGPVLPFYFSEFSLTEHPFLFLMEGIVAGMFAGLGLGFLQWLLLRKHLPNAGFWIGSNILGWGLGLNFILIATYLPFSPPNLLSIILMGAAGGLLAGLCAGIVTGSFLIRRME